MRKLRWKWSSLWMAGLLLAACSLFEPEKKTRFDYGGDPLPGTENLYNLRLSPDGEWVALIRAYTPERLDPPNQLWLVRRDGRQMRFLGASIGSVDWSPDGKRLALNYEPGLCCDTYVVTLDLESGQVAVWTGADTLLLSHPTASFPHWFQDGRRLLVSVIGKAYGQLYETGIYVLNLEHRQVEGPLVKSMVGAQLGGRDRFAVGIMPQPQGRVYRENAVRYEFATGALTVLTDFGPEEAFRFAVTPSPVEDLIVLERRVEGVPTRAGAMMGGPCCFCGMWRRVRGPGMCPSCTGWTRTVKSRSGRCCRTRCRRFLRWTRCLPGACSVENSRKSKT